MTNASIRPPFGWAVLSVLALLALLAGGGCTTQVGAILTTPNLAVVSPSLSPVAEEVDARTAWHLAEDYAQHHPGCDVLVGSGDSMLPFYHDKTILVVAALPMADLRSGMTVIFTGTSGWPVAHLLVEKTSRGWRTMGLGNLEADESTVRPDNYIGTVVRAFAPTRHVAMRTEPHIGSEIEAMAETESEAAAHSFGAVAAIDRE